MARSKYEIKAQKELENQNWLVDFKVRPSRPGKFPTDYFHLFDLLAIRSGDPLRMISIKGHAGVPKAHRDALEAFFVPMGIQKEIWVYKNNKTVKKEILI